MRCHHAVGGRLLQGAAVAGQRGLHLRQAGANGIAVFIRILRHEQQGIADGLHRGGDVIQAAYILAVVVQIEIKAEAIAQDGRGDIVHVIKVILIIGLIGGVI